MINGSEGGANVFDLNKDYDFTGDVQKNIAILHEMFGESFIIKNKSNIGRVWYIYVYFYFLFIFLKTVLSST